MAMDKINGSPLIHQSAVDKFRNAERGNGPSVDGQAAGGIAPGVGTDKAEISTAARQMVDLRHAVDVGRMALAALPDVRDEKVAQARERLATGFYNSVEVRDTVAERLGNLVRGMDTP